MHTRRALVEARREDGGEGFRRFGDPPGEGGSSPSGALADDMTMTKLPGASHENGADTAYTLVLRRYAPLRRLAPLANLCGRRQLHD